MVDMTAGFSMALQHAPILCHIFIVPLACAYLEYVQGDSFYSREVCGMVQPSHYVRTVDYRNVVWC